MLDIFDCFDTLGLKPTTSLIDIKKAYRELAFLHHPDRGGDNDTFVKVKLAYEYIIANPYEPPPRSSFSEDGYAQPKTNPNAPKKPFTSSMGQSFGRWDSREEVAFEPMGNELDGLGYSGTMADGAIIYHLPLEVAYNGGNIWIHIPNYEPVEVKIAPMMMEGHKQKVILTGKASWLKGYSESKVVMFKIAQHEVFTLSEGNLYCSFRLSLADILVDKTPLRIPHPSGKSSIPINLPPTFELGNNIELPDLGFPNVALGKIATGSIIISIFVTLPDLDYHQTQQIKAILNETRRST